MDFQQMQSLLPAMRQFLERFRPFFKRSNTFEYLARYIGGLMMNLDRKSIEPIALATEVPVRTLQEFLSAFVWDHQRAEDALQRLVADEHSVEGALGILDASGHPKQGDQTPGVQHQYCGERGKQENCVVGQHLLYTDANAANPFSCVLDSQLYIPQSWIDDPERCRQAHMPKGIVFKTKWQIGLEQIGRAVGNGIRFAYILGDADYGRVPAFWFGLDALGQRGICFVPPEMACWTHRPACCSNRAEHGSKQAQHLLEHSPAFRDQPWRKVKVKVMTRGRAVWRFKAARVHLVAQKSKSRHRPSIPTDRQYWLLVAENVRTGERKYIVSNEAAQADPAQLLRLAMERWHVEQWFERAKQECGLGAFEVRNYPGLIRHWLCSRLAMLFLARETRRLRGEKSEGDVRAGGTRCQDAGEQTLEPGSRQLACDPRVLLLSSAP